jgi:hypothetical protein
MPYPPGRRERRGDRDSAAELVSTSRRRLEVEEVGLELRVMWQRSRGDWGKVLCGLPRFAFLLGGAAGRSPQGGKLLPVRVARLIRRGPPSVGRSCCGLLMR